MKKAIMAKKIGMTQVFTETVHWYRLPFLKQAPAL